MLQEKQIKSIENVLVSTRKELVSTMVNNVNSSKFDIANDAMKDISTINKMIEILGIKNPMKKETIKNSKSTETEVKETVNKRGRKKKNIFKLGDDLKSKRPKFVEINGNKHSVSSFRDMTKVICEEVFSLNPTAFLNLENVEDVNGSENLYFSKSNENVNEATQITARSGETCFIDVTKLSINNMLFLRKMLKIVGVNENDIKIEIDPSYERKPRTTNKVAEA